MSRRVRGIAAIGVGCLPLAVATAMPAGASSPVAIWQMNEGRGASVMVDSSGHGHHGHVGSRIATGVPTPSYRGYYFPSTSAATASRIVTVPDSSSLDPGRSSFAVTLRFKTVATWPNLVQKGQATTPGGYWKVDLIGGIAYCTFRDSTRRTKAIGSSQRLSDGRWHWLRCARTSAGVSLTVDGAVRTNRGAIGSVSNSMPLTVGGKLLCTAPGVGCDNFVGTMDYVRIDR